VHSPSRGHGGLPVEAVLPLAAGTARAPLRFLGPVLLPPCMRPRPFFIAGARHGSPRRAVAPQRGALLGSPAPPLPLACGGVRQAMGPAHVFWYRKGTDGRFAAHVASGQPF
jgi:hypothetical protein